MKKSNLIDKDILFTFDYELGLGNRSGSVENCIISPTKKIQKLLKKYDSKAIFFVDTTHLMAMEDNFEKSSSISFDYNKIKNQIISLSNDGHYIYHHIHPHWLDAKYIKEDNEWDLSKTSKFSLESLNQKTQKKLFKRSKGILDKFLSEANTKKPVEGFRAGGLYIQPFKNLVPIFNEYNIKYEFSVLKGAISENKDCKFDFSSAPTKSVYSLSDDVLIEDNSGNFVEITLEQIELKNIKKILNGLHYRLFKNIDSYKIFSDGFSTGNKIESKSKSKLKTKETISLELLNPVRFYLYLDFIQKNSFTHFISHPKLMSQKSIYYFEKLLKIINNQYKINSDLKSILKNY